MKITSIKNTFILKGLSGLFVSFLFVFVGASSVHASVTPTMTISTISSNSIQLNVTGDPYATVNLYYYSNGANPGYGGAAVSVGNIGTLNSNGVLIAPVGIGSNTSYNIPYNSYVYVTVGGLASQAVIWPYYSYGYNQTTTIGNMYFSFSNLNMVIGQTQIVQVNPVGTYYVSNNTNPSVVTATINNGQLSLNALAIGNSTITVCQNALCISMYVTVTYSTNSNYGYNNYNYNNNGYYGYNYNSTYTNTSSQYTPATVYNR